jgi:transposase
VKEAAGDAEKIRIMFEDEARFGRISDPRHCWALKGTRPVVPRQFVREYTYAYAAVSPYDGILDSLVLPDVNAKSMSIFLSIISERHPDELILMFMDQAAWHKAKALEIPANIKLLNLPPYSPELNPTEHLWEDIREQWFPNLVFKSIAAVEDTLVEGLVSLERDAVRVAKLTGFKWIISAIKVAT